MNIQLRKTSSACPEQYDAIDEQGNIVGYLRLRHGFFSVEYPDVGGQLIYEAMPKGDGTFFSEERGHYLYEAIKAIEKKILETRFGEEDSQ